MRSGKRGKQTLAKTSSPLNVSAIRVPMKGATHPTMELMQMTLRF